MNFAFFGTDEFSVKVLETLKGRGLVPSLIVTVPDKPKGRKMIMTPPLVKVWGEENGVKIIQPASLKNFLADPKSDLVPQSTTSDQLSKKDFEKLDFSLVASYGKIIPQEILDLPTHGTLNIHPSLLPKYRGPSPLETAILNGDSETGVTIIKLDTEMDHGPVLAQEPFDLSSEQGVPLYNFEQLRDKTAELGAELLVKFLPDYLSDLPAQAGKIELQEQGHDQATYTKKFVKPDGFLDPSSSTLINYRKILALNPWPGTYLEYPGPTGKIRVIIRQAHLEENELVYDLVTPEGRKEMTWVAFLNGFKK
ncbi:MAG: methionyl-tRNA formyltransferase [Candidatus Paceibacterota bacterium]|jgi:methionyl-tRNA formyltransferase